MDQHGKIAHIVVGILHEFLKDNAELQDLDPIAIAPEVISQVHLDRGALWTKLESLDHENN